MIGTWDMIETDETITIPRPKILYFETKTHLPITMC